MSSVLFALEIEEIFAVSLSADALLSPTGSLKKWSQLIEKAQSGESDRPNFESVHGSDTTAVHSKDLSLDKFIDAQTLDAANQLPSVGQEAKTVLLTGGNGFLGHIVCLEWLEKLAAVNGKLICLIRGSNNSEARKRLDAAFSGVDPKLEQRYQQLAEQHLEVLAGDAGEHQLGLNDADYARLSQQVDRISHVAALVNHRLSYQHLFVPNVVGTAEIIKLAITTQKKTVDFVSTEAVMTLGLTLTPDEDAALSESANIGDFYVVGYGTSKWAGEYLLQQAQQQFGLAVNTFRGDMMLTDERYTGQINDSDMFTRIIYSVAITGLAPYSFYRINQDGSKASAHYDGTPVNVVAATVCGVDDNTSEYRTFNICNYHHDDGCSLDTFVDAIESAGFAINRIQDYKQWLERFTDKLNTLPEQQRKQSALEILPAFASAAPAVLHQVGSEHFQALVPSLTDGKGVPHLDEDYIHKCLRDLAALGLLSDAITV